MPEEKKEAEKKTAPKAKAVPAIDIKAMSKIAKAKSMEEIVAAVEGKKPQELDHRGMAAVIDKIVDGK